MENLPLGQLLLMGIPGTTLDAPTIRLIEQVQPGGFILFGRNIQTPEQLRHLIDSLRKHSEIEPIITIDQEGGRVSRLKLLGNEPPNAYQLRSSENPELIRRHGEITGKLLKLFGFNLDLCPVLDIAFDEEADNSLRGRCYGNDADQVIELAGIFNDALRATGILSCGKHFPGYSCAPSDPHYDLSALQRSRSELEANELKVFRHFASPSNSKSQSASTFATNVQFQSRSVDSMMIGHISFAELDSSGLPASLSPNIITQLLREEMGFKGLIMTDDLDMGAIINNYTLHDMLRLGLSAGNDLLMICHRTELAEEAVQHLATFPQEQVERAIRNIALFKARMAPPDPFSLTAFKALDDEVWQLRVDTLGEEKAKERSPEDGKRSPVEVY
ncbi:MAG: glycoside hydrolase family 3 N-terminal domain-containing protein [Verrucomicrobiae bacterium]|jgi:beta-N-acetylhexosaminidase|nr:glycoside hydrolase family 3 N-terminal domain-containing protein [Verrucomicrobiae bacterium]